MKKLLLSLGCLFVGILPMMAEVSASLQPESCTIGNRPFTSPLSEVAFYFDGAIQLLNGASAKILCDGEPVATASKIEASNHTYKRTQGALTISFDGQMLPIGKSYQLVVAPSSIAAENDAAVTNTEIVQSFDVPANLGEARVDAKDGSIISTASESIYENLPACYWGIETEPAGTPSYILYREGVAVREIPARVTWDWDLGQAYPDVQEKMNFEQGVHYTLTLPAGSVHAMYRDDIVNEEVSFNFVGGYTEPIEPLTYVWCSLFTDHSNVLNEVTFQYNRPVKLGDNPVVQLWCDDTELLKEVPAEIEADANCWLLKADFGGFEMTGEKGYSLVIPEGTVIAENGDPVVNPRNTMAVNGCSGIESIQADNSEDSILYDLSGRKVITAEPGKIYIQNGRKVIKTNE